MHQAINRPADPFQQLAKKTLEFRMELFKLIESQGWKMNANDRKYVLYPLETIQEYLMGVADTEDDGESWFRFEGHGDVRYKSLSPKFEGNDPITEGSELLWKINQLIKRNT